MTTTVSPSSSVSPRVKLTTRQRTCLEQITRGQTNAQRLVRRANILLALDTGASHGHIPRQMHLNRGTVRVWHRRWLALTPKLERIEAEGSSDKVLTTVIVESLTDQPRAGAPATFTAEQLSRLSRWRVKPPRIPGGLSVTGRPARLPMRCENEGFETISTRSVGRFLKSG